MASSQTIDSSVQQNSNKPVSGGAVYTAIQSIPAPLSPAYKNGCFTSATNWQAVGCQAIVFGCVVNLTIGIRATTSISLSESMVYAGSLNSDIPPPNFTVVMVFISDSKYQSSEWLACFHLIATLSDSLGRIFFQIQPDTIIPADKYLVGSATYAYMM
jgi:hypothetical protein